MRHALTLSLVSCAVGLAACGVSQSTHRAVVDQLAAARAELDRERARSATVARECEATKSSAEPVTKPEPEQTYSQATPREAIASFIAAFEAKRWDIVVRFVPAKHADDITEDKIRDEVERSPEIRENIEAIKRALEANVEITVDGDKAEMRYAEGDEVELIREDGVWKIEDLD